MLPLSATEYSWALTSHLRLRILVTSPTDQVSPVNSLLITMRIPGGNLSITIEVRRDPCESVDTPRA